MAEFVQQSIEEMLPELEQMERVGLFTKSETRQILKKRKAYEYKLRRRTKCKKDFLEYIQYEINVLSLIRKRREKLGYTFKRAEIDIAIVVRIHKLFRLVCSRFQDDIKLWLSHIEFSKSRLEKARVSKLFTKMLQIHNKEPDIWILAAKWEFEENSNSGNARSIMQRGLRFIPESKKLWLEYYRLELLIADKLRKRYEILGGSVPKTKDKSTDAVLQGHVALVVYNQALEIFPDDDKFLLSFMPVCRLFKFTESHEKQMLQDLQNKFPHSVLTWDAVARQHLHRRSDDGQSGQIDLSENDEMLCLKVYKEAVEKIPTKEMWSIYLHTCLELIQWDRTTKTKERRSLQALDTLEVAATQKQVTEELFFQWLELLTSLTLLDKANRVSELGTVHYPSSVSLWKYRLKLMVESLKCEEDVLSTFQSACFVLSDKESWPMWSFVFRHCIINNSESLENLFEKAITCCQEVCKPAKELYLQWTFLTSGIEKARQLYKRLAQVKPLSLEFYKKYLAIEDAQIISKMKLKRRAYEDAVENYGNHDPDLWIDYIKLEMNHQKGPQENIGKIHFCALKCLQGEMNQEFITKFTLVQTGHL